MKRRLPTWKAPRLPGLGLPTSLATRRLGASPDGHPPLRGSRNGCAAMRRSATIDANFGKRLNAQNPEPVPACIKAGVGCGIRCAERWCNRSGVRGSGPRTWPWRLERSNRWRKPCTPLSAVIAGLQRQTATVRSVTNYANASASTFRRSPPIPTVSIPCARPGRVRRTLAQGPDSEPGAGAPIRVSRTTLAAPASP